MKKLAFLLVTLIFLTACQSNWVVDVDLTAEEKAEIQADIKDIKSRLSADMKSSDYIQAVISLARKYEDLGQLSDAIDVYVDTLKNENLSAPTVNRNLALLYEKIGKFEKAIEQYQILIDKYLDENYLYDITWAYINMGERREAEKYFNAWQLKFQKTDVQTQDAIKKLREEEKDL